jgi:hypothetical protein
MVLGMVTLGKRHNRVKEVMFVTNVGFRMEGGLEEPYIDPMTIESIDLLDDLGVILTLAEGVQDLDNELRRYRRLKTSLRRKMNEMNLLFKDEEGPEADAKPK